MALALSMSSCSSRAVHCLSPWHNERLFVGHLKPLNLVLPRHPLSGFALAFSRRRNNDRAITSSSSKKKKKKNLPHKDDDDHLEDDPFEALFSQLEEDLKNDSTVDDDDEISEEDLDKLALELEEALGDVDLEMFNRATEEEEEEEEEEVEEKEEEEDDDDEEKEREVRLKNWQLRKLAYALKTGRRRVSIKSLAAELCLDRAIVLEMLREPPPNLLMMSAALPDEPEPTVLVHEVKHTETTMAETTIPAVEPKTKVEEPVHDRQHRWSTQKRLKKVQVKTLEMVYRRSKRPTNAMISSIVHVTNLPRRRIVNWFEDKRAEEGVPEHRTPYQRSDPETVSSS